MPKWVVPQTDGRLRLDIFITKQLNQPRHQIQKMIKSGQIKVNNQLITTPHHWLKEETKIEMVAVNNQNHALLTSPKIIKEANDYMVINKPAGTIVHGGAGINQPTLTDWLLKRHPKIKKVGDDPARPGIVHRLDKLVSGCLVMALSPNMFDHLKKQFTDRAINKEYLALVAGRLEKDEGVIDRPIGRNKTGRLNAHQRPLAHDREAITVWKVIKRFTNATLLKLKPITGRTHQLRLHCRAMGHPIIGDPLYAKVKHLGKLPKLERLFLHATKLKFTDLQNNPITINCSLPKELTTYLRQLKPLWLIRY